MIASLRGLVESVDDSAPQARLVLGVQGVGYELWVSGHTLGSLHVGRECHLHVYTHVRDQEISLFGFAQKLERVLFMALLGVRGVGPKVALHILSSTTFEALVGAVQREDIKALGALPRVGKKKAEQMLIHLREPFRVLNLASGGVDYAGVRSALVNLNFRADSVDEVLQKMPPNLSWEEGVKFALRHLQAPQPASPPGKEQ